MQIKKDEELFCKRMLELAHTSFYKGIQTYSDFLNLNEINLFYTIVTKLSPVKYSLFGGHTDSERRILCFSDKDSDSIPEFPIDCIHISPINQKFSDDLTHRDFLGALVHLGIDRSKLGDILIKENDCYLFCENHISHFINDNLQKIKHTCVKCQLVSFPEINYVPNYTKIIGTVASLRLDAVLSLAFKTSRNSLTGLIASSKVYVNSRIVLSNSYILKDDDIVSVRGLGKFIYKETNTQTKKGRYSITLLKYT